MAPAAAMGAAVLQHVRAPAQPVLDLFVPIGTRARMPVGRRPGEKTPL